MRVALLLIGFAAGSLAQDQQLTQLRATVQSLRQKRDLQTAADAEVTRAKHQFRDWVEHNLMSFSPVGAEKEFAARLNAELRAAKLTCEFRRNPDDHGGDFCPDDWNELGYLDDVSLERESGFLVVTTGVGLPACQSSGSAYAYRRVGTRWQRVLEDEVAGGRDVHIVEISAAARDESRVAAVLGWDYGCASVWHSMIYRIWRFGGPVRTPTLILSGSEVAHIGGTLRARAAPDEVLIEFTSLNHRVNLAFQHTSIRRFSIQGDAAQQTDPVALTPVGFLNEWFDADWLKSARWSESPSLQQWHQASQSGFSDQGKQCTKDPNVWQAAADYWGTSGRPEGPAYFLVRWKPPYDFSVVDIRTAARPDCTVEDSARTDEKQSLFPPTK